MAAVEEGRIVLAERVCALLGQPHRKQRRRRRVERAVTVSGAQAIAVGTATAAATLCELDEEALHQLRSLLAGGIGRGLPAAHRRALRSAGDPAR